MSSLSGRPHLRLLHLSDLHVGLTYGFPAMSREEQAGIPLAVLSQLAVAARRERAGLIVIAGDFFDHNRVPRALVKQTWEMIDACPCPVVILPGNHDPFMHDSPYIEPLPPGLQVLSKQEGELLEFPQIGAEIWGQAHTRYDDFDPCGQLPGWSDEPGRWRIAIAHGHFVQETTRSRFSYQIRPSDLAQLNADYVALGHWDFMEDVSAPGVGAWYSGSPCRTHDFTRVELSSQGVTVDAIPIFQE